MAPPGGGASEGGVLSASTAGVSAGRVIEPHSPAPGRQPTRRQVLTVALWVLGAAVLGAWLYVLTVHANSLQVDSDGATVVLQGRAMASGNVVLHGWSLSLDSWWSLDVPMFAAAILAVGMRPALLLAVPAAITALVVVCGVILARRGHRDRAALAGAAVVVVALALPVHQLAVLLICGPIHVSTALFTLVAFLGLRRNRFGWGWVVAVVFLAAGLLGDLQIWAYGVAPALVAGAVAARRQRSVWAGSVPMTAAGASVVLAYAVRRVVDLLGGFSIGPTNSLASPHQMLANLAHLPSYLAQLLGILPGASGDGGVPEGLQVVHVVVAVLLAAGVVWGLGRLLRGVWRARLPAAGDDQVGGQPAIGTKAQPIIGTKAQPTIGTKAQPTIGTEAQPTDDTEEQPWRLDDLLAIAVLGPVFDFVVLSRTTGASYQRYLTATVIFAAVLAGRAVTSWLASDRSRPPHLLARRTVLAVAGATAACCLAAGVIQVCQPVPPEPTSRVVRFLEAHHLTLGVGDYWSASIATVESGGRVEVRPVVPDFGHLEAYGKGDVKAWFDGVRFQFLLWKGVVGPGGVSRRSAVETWGQPRHTYRVGDYRILVWPKLVEVHGVQPS